MEIEGKIIVDIPMVEGTSRSGNPWKKKEWVLETFDTYPKKVKFTVFGEQRMQNIQLEVGKVYTLSVDIESREFQGRWYTDVMCYASRESAGPQMNAPQGSPTAPANPFGPAPVNFGPAPAAPGAPTDDLPF